MGAHDDAEEIEPVDRAEWRAWLRDHHATSSGVWVITFKKAAGADGPTYEDLVQEALCFGWIDSRPGKVDDRRTKLYLCPRRKGSGWAASNKARITELVRQGLMTPAGQAVIDEAIADGSWTRFDADETTEIPPELEAALRRYPGSRRKFEAFPPSIRKQLIFAVNDAKRADTKLRRSEEIASKAQHGERAFQWQPKESS